MPADSSVIDPVAPLAEEFVARYRNGERPALSEYIARCPEQEARIRQLFPMLVMMEQAVPSEGATVGDQPLVAPELQQVGDFRILREIGRGGMGVVYEAEQVSLGRRVALKVLPLTPARDGAGLERFRREARAAAHLHHGNIVPVYEVGEEGGVCFYAMQLVRGQPLDVVLDELRRLQKSGGSAVLPVVDAASLPEKADPSSVHSNRQLYHRSVARIGVQVARALEYAHAQGIVHRDVKPSNLLLDTEGRVWLTDFGLAHTDGAALTRTGDVVGTLRYMAPERFNGWSDARSDVYSLGLTLYELLVLRPAFAAGDQAELLQAILHGELPALRKQTRDVPRDLETIIGRAIDREPSRRYAGAAELADDLERFLEDRPIQARRSGAMERAWRWCRRNPAVAGLLAALLLTLVAGLVSVSLAWRAERRQRQIANASAEKIKDESLKLQQAEAAITEGDLLAFGLRFQEAERELTRATELRPDLARGWQRRANLYLRLGLWDLAERDLLRGKPSASSRPGPWLERALLRLLAGDIEGYRGVVSGLVAALQGREEAEGSDLARTCNLSPLAAVDRTRIVALSRYKTRAAASFAWLSLYIQGGALVRAGRGREAIELFNRSLGATRFEARALNYPFLALAHHQAGEPLRAREALEQAHEAYESFVTRMLRQQDLYTALQPQYWHDWVEFQVLYREARETIHDGAPIPEDGRLWSLRARALTSLGRTEEARAAHDHAVRVSPDELGTRLHRLAFLVQQADRDAIASERRRIEAICGTNYGMNEIALRAYAAMGQHDAARAAHRRMMAERPNNTGVRLALFRWLHSLGQAREAERAWADATRDGQTAVAHMRQGDELASMQLWERASDEYGKAIDKGSTDGEVWFRHGLLQHYLGRVAEYRRGTLAKLLARFDRDDQPLAARWLAQLCLLDPEYPDPERILKLARRWEKAQPLLAGNFSLEGCALVRAGQPYEAIARLDKALKSRGTTEMKIALALAHDRAGGVDRALGLLREVPIVYRKVAPGATESREVWHQRLYKQLLYREAAEGRALRLWEDVNGAIQARQWPRAERLLARLPQSQRRKWTYWYWLATCAYERGRPREALRYMEEATRLQPRLERHLTLHWAFAILRIDQGDLQGYRDDCARRVAAHKPSDPPLAGLFLAWYCRLGPGAVSDYGPLEAILRQQQKSPDWKAQNYLHLGAILLRAGKAKEALPELEKAVAAWSPVWDQITGLWLALAHHALGDDIKAREQLAKTDAWLKKHRPGPGAPYDWGGAVSWPYWLKLKILRREVAEALGAGRR